MKHYYALSAIGTDRPGIVADVAGLIYESGGNLEDSSMTLLGNQFALIILLSGSGEDFQFRLSAGCKRLEWEKRLSVFLTPVEESTGQSRSGEFSEYELTTTGMDRVGIVYNVSRLLADRSINITNMHTRIAPSPETGTPVFTMKIELQVPREISAATLLGSLNTLGEKLAIEISLKKGDDRL
jgi:glycine cleavage system transcriptional repressor